MAPAARFTDYLQDGTGITRGYRAGVGDRQDLLTKRAFRAFPPPACGLETVQEHAARKALGFEDHAVTPGRLGAIHQRPHLPAKGVPCPFEYPDFSIMWQALRSAGPMQGAIQKAGEATIRQAVRAASEPFENERGIRLENQFKYAVATR